MVDTVVVILKVSERCNINCTYCYFFNGIDQTYQDHPPKISLEIIEQIAIFFKNACQHFQIKTLRFDFHGGEPLLVKPVYLDKVCQTLVNSLSSLTNLEFSLQTNAMLINEKWIELFNKYKINIGVSIDGTEEYHNKYRIDRKGKGSYQKTREGLELIRKFFYQKKVNFGLGALCVINPEFSGRNIYRHFVDDLKLNSFDFLLPDNTWDSIKNNNFKAEDYGLFLSEIFDEWVKDNNPKIFVRILSSIASGLQAKRLHFHDFGGWLENFLLITISSNGNLSPDDTYRSASPQHMNIGLNVYTSTFDQLLNNSAINLLRTSANLPASYCQNCEWIGFCKSGSLLHRYSTENGFENHSVYCEGLKIIYKRMFDFLLDHKATTVA